MSNTESEQANVGVSITMPTSLKDAIERIAKDEDRSVSSVIRYILRQALQEQQP